MHTCLCLRCAQPRTQPLRGFNVHQRQALWHSESRGHVARQGSDTWSNRCMQRPTTGPHHQPHTRPAPTRHHTGTQKWQPGHISHTHQRRTLLFTTSSSIIEAAMICGGRQVRAGWAEPAGAVRRLAPCRWVQQCQPVAATAAQACHLLIGSYAPVADCAYKSDSTHGTATRQYRQQSMLDTSVGTMAAAGSPR